MWTDHPTHSTWQVVGYTIYALWGRTTEILESDNTLFSLDIIITLCDIIVMNASQGICFYCRLCSLAMLGYPFGGKTF